MKKILIGTSVRQSEEVFKYYLDGLDNLIVPNGYEIHMLFCLHNSDHLIPILQNHPRYKKTLDFIVKNDEIEYKKDETTHHWNDYAINTITVIKNFIMDYARNNGYEYMFFVDSDLVLQPETLCSLVHADKDIVNNVFWTKWSPDEPEQPNAWDYDHYVFKDGSVSNWHNKGLYRVGMSGACTLISRKVLDCNNVNYNRVNNLTYWGEDRHFCIRAAAHEFEIWLSTFYPATHLYRDSEVEKYRNTLSK